MINHISKYIKYTHLKLFLLCKMFHKNLDFIFNELKFYFYLFNVKDNFAFLNIVLNTRSLNRNSDYVF